MNPIVNNKIDIDKLMILFNYITAINKYLLNYKNYNSYSTEIIID